MAQTESAERVTDEVWVQLAGEAGRVDEAEARVLRRSALGVAAILSTALCLWGLGLVSPRLDHGSSSGSTMDSVAHAAQYDFDLVNRGLWPVTVAGVSINIPGVVVTSTTPQSLTVPRASTRHLRVALHVRDCTAATHAVRTDPASRTAPLHVLVSRPWGKVSSDVRPPDESWIGDLVLFACGQEPL
jgi:hypothetical protein